MPCEVFRGFPTEFIRGHPEAVSRRTAGGHRSDHRAIPERRQEQPPAGTASSVTHVHDQGDVLSASHASEPVPPRCRQTVCPEIVHLVVELAVERSLQSGEPMRRAACKTLLHRTRLPLERCTRPTLTGEGWSAGTSCSPRTPHADEGRTTLSDVTPACRSWRGAPLHCQPVELPGPIPLTRSPWISRVPAG